MHKVFSDLLNNFTLTGDIEKDSWNLFEQYNCIDIAEHSIKVADEAKKLALRFGVDESDALVAGYLHDISGIFPNSRRIDVCNELGIEILAEEYIAPSLLHSKISRAMASDIFKINNQDILNAIECHSTLKVNASRLGMVVFIADKIQSFTNNLEFIDDIIQGLEISLEHGAFAYLKFLYNNKENLKVFHPWAREAYNDLKMKHGMS